MSSDPKIRCTAVWACVLPDGHDGAHENIIRRPILHPNEPSGPEDAPSRPGSVTLCRWAELLRETSLGPTGERVCEEMEEWARRIDNHERPG